jgi:hypothetical protein
MVDKVSPLRTVYFDAAVDVPLPLLAVELQLKKKHLLM